LGREQKKRNDGGGGEERRNFSFPFPLPLPLFFSFGSRSNFRAITRLETLARQAIKPVSKVSYVRLASLSRKNRHSSQAAREYETRLGRAGEGTRDEAESVHFEQKQEDIQNLSSSDQ